MHTIQHCLQQTKDGLQAINVVVVEHRQDRLVVKRTRFQSHVYAMFCRKTVPKTADLQAHNASIRDALCTLFTVRSLLFEVRICCVLDLLVNHAQSVLSLKFLLVPKRMCQRSWVSYTDNSVLPKSVTCHMTWATNRKPVPESVRVKTSHSQSMAVISRTRG